MHNVIQIDSELHTFRDGISHFCNPQTKLFEKSLIDDKADMHKPLQRIKLVRHCLDLLKLEPTSSRVFLDAFK